MEQEIRKIRKKLKIKRNLKKKETGRNQDRIRKLRQDRRGVKRVAA